MPYRHDFEAIADWGPLEAVALLLARDDVEVELENFMHMGCAVNEEGNRVFLYKHVNTRRYLNLDKGGQAYVFRVIRRRGKERHEYELFPSLLLAVWRAQVIEPPLLAS